MIKAKRTVDYPYHIMQVELTNQCVMKCIMCPRSKYMTRTVGFMDMTLFRSIMDQYAADNPNCGDSIMWLHHLGESLLHPEFDQAMAYASGLGLNPSLSINPILLTADKAQRLFSAHPHTILIMLDGCDNESFAELRGYSGRDGYDKSLENSLRALEICARLSPSTDVQLNIIDIPSKKEMVDRAVEMLSQQGIKIERKPFGVWSGKNDDINNMTKDSDPALFCPNANPCIRPLTDFAILWDGRVVGCCHDYNGFVILGDAKQQKLIDIWNGNEMQEFRWDVTSGVGANRLCCKCPCVPHYPKEIVNEKWFIHLLEVNINLHEEIISLRKEISEKTSLRYFAGQVKAFFCKGMLRKIK